MSPINLILWGAGVVLIAAGYLRARTPWRRYQEIKAQEANISRYEGWRGTRLRDDGPTAASLMAAELRNQARLGIAIAVIGLILVFAGFVIH